MLYEHLWEWALNWSYKLIFTVTIIFLHEVYSSVLTYRTYVEGSKSYSPWKARYCTKCLQRMQTVVKSGTINLNPYPLSRRVNTNTSLSYSVINAQLTWLHKFFYRKKLKAKTSGQYLCTHYMIHVDFILFTWNYSSHFMTRGIMWNL